MTGTRLPRLINLLLILLVVNAIGAGWTGVFLLQRAADQRADQALRAEQRTEDVRQDVAELLDELVDPVTDTRRAELFDRAVRIEQLLEDLHDRTEETP